MLKHFVISIITAEASAVLKRFKPAIISVNGSVGKTSTKDAIYTGLVGSIFVRKNEKSFNSEIGAPLTILGLPNGWNNPFLWLINIIRGVWLAYGPLSLQAPYPKLLVLELGADKPGDIVAISKWIKPNMAVVTRIPEVPVHIEFFPSKEDVIREKSAIVKVLKPNGALILNADDETVLGMKLFTNRDKGHRIYTFGFTERADVRAINVRLVYEGTTINTVVTCTWKKSISSDAATQTIKSTDAIDTTETADITIRGAIGVQHVYPILASLTVAYARGENMSIVAERLNHHVPPKGRMNIIEGINSSLIIDDTYNSSPVAVEEALKALKSIDVLSHDSSSDNTPKKIAVLGDMMELGQYSVAEHAKVGELATTHADILVTVGIRSKGTAAAARTIRPDMEIHEVKNSIDACAVVTDIVKKQTEGSMVLVKGSQSMRMERIVVALLAQPDTAKEVTVRQESQWLSR